MASLIEILFYCFIIGFIISKVIKPYLKKYKSDLKKTSEGFNKEQSFLFD